MRENQSPVSPMDKGAKQPATWRIVLAFILDFFTIFWIAGLGVAFVFGGTTENGFSLNGLPALLCFVLMIAYFVVFNRYLGGTIWKRILRAKRTDR
ncbi:putative RDD family membrane protein YckC [Neorhizobium huautlense]|uniref:RDD family membrane protein YckC n=1 Tax=Neorhizobium huautlense TaxID=67774 RepID=A0ABT9PQ70_9HYPH|nr:RDD family protein [Neorhizobium huautlense]MDP9836618.1 putative RDD family membrane protein YckC [Neorhizobium huautlense]